MWVGIHLLRGYAPPQEREREEREGTRGKYSVCVCSHGVAQQKRGNERMKMEEQKEGCLWCALCVGEKEGESLELAASPKS